MSRALEVAGKARVFAALGDATRLSLVVRLSGGEPQSITHLSAGSKLTRQAVTKHLRVLEGAGIVRGVKAGRESLYAFEPGRVEEVKEFLEGVSKAWDRRLERLRVFVEG